MTFDLSVLKRRVFGDTAYSDQWSRELTRKDEPRNATSKISDLDLLLEIRDRYKSYDLQWKPSRREREIDMRYISGDPWDPLDRKAREEADRPCISHDELGQYVNTAVNGVRQNKRGIKADPYGYGSNEQTALLRQDIIRTIEYESNAPSIYASAFQAMVEGSYAFFRIGRKYASDDADSDSPILFDQEIVIRPVSNPNSVLFDPNCKEPDWSDGKACFVFERIPRREFAKLWPGARITDFTFEHSQVAGDWILAEDVIVAEYWRVEEKDRWKYLLADGRVVDDPQDFPVEQKRKVTQKSITQYLTNGIEILDRIPQPGSILPIVPMIGLERYLDVGGVPKRVLFSLVRLARDPQMSLAYLNSLEMEEAGLTPKTPFVGYKGQFDSNKERWATVTKTPWAYLETDIPDNWPVGQIPPHPQRVPFTPNFQQYEIAKDSCRRAIQAAMGITPLPTAAQRANQKSALALQKIEDMQDIGSFHFVDGYDRALRLAGKIVDKWIPQIYESQRNMHIRKPDDSYRIITINTPIAYIDQKTGQPVHYPVTDVDHTISISTGPSYTSQREAASDFLDVLVANLPNLPVSPPAAAKLLSLAIQMKNLGPKGDEMAEIISPSEGSPDMNVAQLQQAQAQLQQQGILIQQLQSELQRLTVERQAKVVEGEYRLLTEKMRSDANLLIERLKVDAQVATAEIQTKSQMVNERISTLNELQRQNREMEHEQEMQQKEQEHDMRIAQHDALQKALELRHKADSQRKTE